MVSYYKSFVIFTSVSIAGAVQNISYPTRRFGTANIIAFGGGGVSILRNTLNPVVQLVSTEFGYNTGWTAERHVRFVADATGDGAEDIIGFGDDGVYIAPNIGNYTFGTSTLVVPQFGAASSAGGWSLANTRLVVDLRKTGLVDLFGFADNGVYIALNNGNLSFSQPALVLDEFGYNQGWRTESHLRFVADVNGDGYPDIVGFGQTDVTVSLSNGDGTFQAPYTVLEAFTIGSGGWDVYGNPRHLADLNGDGFLDIIGFGDGSVAVSLNNGNGTFQPLTEVLNDYGYNSGWTIDNPRVIADANGDGIGDIVGFGTNGVYVSINNGDATFQAPRLVVNNFGSQASGGGWHVSVNPRFMTDLNGDGLADILGFGDGGVVVSYNNGNGSFTQETTIIAEFGLNQGWTEDVYMRNPANLYC